MKSVLLLCHFVFLYASVRISSSASLKAARLYIENPKNSDENSSWSSYVEIEELEEPKNTYRLIAKEGDLEKEIVFKIDFIYLMIEKIVVFFIHDSDQILHVTFNTIHDAQTLYGISLDAKDDVPLESQFPSQRFAYRLGQLSHIDPRTLRILEPVTIYTSIIVIEKLSKTINGETYRIVVKSEGSPGYPFMICYPSSCAFKNLPNFNMVLVMYENDVSRREYNYFLQFLDPKFSFVDIMSTSVQNDYPGVIQQFYIGGST